MFPVIFFTNLSVINIRRYPPYLKSEICIPKIIRKGNRKVKFQQKFLIVKRIYSKILPLEPPKICIFEYLIWTVFKTVPSVEGLRPPPTPNPWFIPCAFIYSFVFFCVFAFKDMLASEWKINVKIFKFSCILSLHLILSFWYLWTSPSTEPKNPA